MAKVRDYRLRAVHPRTGEMLSADGTRLLAPVRQNHLWLGSRDQFRCLTERSTGATRRMLRDLVLEYADAEREY